MSGEAMSEKQVVKDYVKDPMFEENTLLPIKWGDEWLMLDDVIAFMNMLTDENRQLKKKIKGLEKENKQLRMRLLNYEQKNNDNGDFQAWEVPPIPEEERISFIIKYGGDGV